MGKYRADTHIHTEGSGDCTEKLENILKRADELSLDMITITDHCEVDTYYQFKCDTGMHLSNETVAKAQGSCKAKLLFGVELGQITRDLVLAEELANMYDYHFIIASLHNSKGYHDYGMLDYKSGELDTDKLLESYYNELIEIAKLNIGDTIAHITYPLRYYFMNNIPYNIDKYKEAIRELYRVIIENGTALECNTSGLRQAIGETFPNKELFKLYRDVGGSLITLGADSHIASDLYAGIDEAREMLKSLSFTEGHYFVNRKIMSYKL